MFLLPNIFFLAIYEQRDFLISWTLIHSRFCLNSEYLKSISLFDIWLCRDICCCDRIMPGKIYKIGRLRNVNSIKQFISADIFPRNVSLFRFTSIVHTLYVILKANISFHSFSLVIMHRGSPWRWQCSHPVAVINPEDGLIQRHLLEWWRYRIHQKQCFRQAPKVRFFFSNRW